MITYYAIVNTGRTIFPKGSIVIVTEIESQIILDGLFEHEYSRWTYYDIAIKNFLTPIKNNKLLKLIL